jgi:hypothetical protein
MKNKYYSAIELKEMIIKENKLPITNNQKGVRFSFIAKVRNIILGKMTNSKIVLR